MTKKISKNWPKYLLGLVIFLFLFIVPLISQADTQELTNPLCAKPGDPNCIEDVAHLFIRVISFMLTGLAIFGLFMIIYGGFLFLMAGGNEETIKKAKATLVWAVIGMAIILTSRIAVQFIASAFGPTTAEIVSERSSPCSQGKMCYSITGLDHPELYGCVPNDECKKISPEMTHCCTNP